jgi:DNA polymerase III sliding clamp (beta) subunit (PCNA family)
MEYLELATSKDETRSNLCAIWRDKTELVATDGHRLHLQYNLPAIEKPHFINGLDAQFPDWQHVMPKGAASTKIIVRITADHVKKLKNVVTLIKHTDKHCSALVNYTEKDISIVADNSQGMRVDFKLVDNFEKLTPFSINLNLKYFTDALHGIDKIGEMVVFQYYGETSPLIIDRVLTNKKAVVMPSKARS